MGGATKNDLHDTSKSKQEGASYIGRRNGLKDDSNSKEEGASYTFWRKSIDVKSKVVNLQGNTHREKIC